MAGTNSGSRGVWFPTVRTGTGTDVFTEQLAEGLREHGWRAEITWLPHRAEYLPWTVPVPKPPAWVDVVHVNSWLNRRFIPPSLPVVSTVHHTNYEPDLLPYKGWVRRLYHDVWIKRVELTNLQRADTVTAVSQATARMCGRYLGVQNVQVIPNGIDVASVPFILRDAPNHPFRLVYVGSWTSRKGVDLFAPIMSYLGESFCLDVVGGPPPEKQRKHCPQNIRFLGRINDRQSLFRLLGECDAFLFPSRSEGLSLALLEAQACGLPVIAANCSSMPEVVGDRVTGILCEKDNVGAFVDAARWLAGHRSEWRDIRWKARDAVSRAFSRACFLDMHLKAYS